MQVRRRKVCSAAMPPAAPGSSRGPSPAWFPGGAAVARQRQRLDLQQAQGQPQPSRGVHQERREKEPRGP
eukprot:11215077-Lingulodinium_polyedra.AAC.1